MTASKTGCSAQHFFLFFSFFVITTSCVHAFAGGEGIFDVKAFGARGNGTSLDTKFIQNAIDSCNKHGGGVVTFPAGQYLTGSIFVKSNVFLEITSGATILGSTNIADYVDSNFIYAESAVNIGFFGHGTINGQGDSFLKGKERPYIRPDYVLHFHNCENVTIREINIRNAPKYSIYLKGCNLVHVEGISIINDREFPNTDGIDPVNSSNVFIRNCYISTGDDAICLKSEDANLVTNNIVVSDCILESDDSAIKCGTASVGAIQNCIFDDITIKNSRYGISLFMKDGGKYGNLKFSNILLQTETEQYATHGRYSFPIFMDIEKRDEHSSFGEMKDIVFDNVNIETYNGNCLFFGQPEKKIEDITLNNITMKILKRIDYSKRHKARGTRTLTNVESNDYANISSHLTVANVEGLTIRNLTIEDVDQETDFERYLLWGKNVNGVLIDGLENEQVVKNKSYPFIKLTDGEDVTVRNSEPDSNAVGFIEIEGKESRDIKLIDNDLTGVTKGIIYGVGAPKNAVHVWEAERKK